MPLQTIPVVQIFDYLYAGSTPLQGVPISVTLNYSQATFTNPIVAQIPFNVTTTTDATGYWTVSVPANSGNPPTVSPANTLYSVNYGAESGYKPFLINVSNIGVPGGGWQASAISVSSPVTLAPTASTVGALTVTGALVAQAGLTVAGATNVAALTASGLITAQAGLTVSAGTTSLQAITAAGALTLTGVPAQIVGQGAGSFTIVGGTTGFTFANNANNAANLTISDPGVVTLRNTLALTAAPGQIQMQGAGTAQILGGTTGFAVNNNANNATNLSLSDTGNATLRGSLTLSGAPGQIIMQGAGTASLVGGTTGFALQNNAANANNLVSTDAGAITLRNALSIPPSAGGTLAATSYGTVPIKVAENVLGAIAATVSFTSIPAGFRHLVPSFVARSDNASTFAFVAMRFNNDSTSGHYGWQDLRASGATTTASESGSSAATQMQVAVISAANSLASAPGHARVVVLLYSGTTFLKRMYSLNSYFPGTTMTSAGQLEIHVSDGVWNSTAAVNEVDFTNTAGNFIVGSGFTLEAEP